MGLNVLMDIKIAGNRFKMEFDVDSPAQASMLGIMMYEKQPYEKETSETLCKLLKPGDTFIDVGAHLGWFTLLGARIVGSFGKVISIEPEEGNYRTMQRHLEMNGLNGTVRCFRAVAASRAGPIDLHINLDNDGGHSLWPCKNHLFNQRTIADPRVVQVDGITLDELCYSNGIGKVSLLKIDTEGAEVEVLRGAERLLGERRLEYVIAEVNDFGLEQLGTSRDEMVSIMEKAGYARINLDETEPGMVYNILFSLKG